MVEMVKLDLQPAATMEGTGFKQLQIIWSQITGFLQLCTLQLAYKSTKSYASRALTTDIWIGVATQLCRDCTFHFIKMGTQDMSVTNNLFS